MSVNDFLRLPWSRKALCYLLSASAVVQGDVVADQVAAGVVNILVVLVQQTPEPLSRIFSKISGKKKLRRKFLTYF